MFTISRTQRTKSNTNVYHVIIRGINRQDIFLDNQDFRKFLKELKRTKELYQYELYAYALMPNHAHFIIHDTTENLSTIMQSLNIRYSYYFNQKYERVGHLFENRFKSKNIEEESYLKNVVRYIHKNPENAGITGHYSWTSYYEYVQNEERIIDKDFIMNLFNNDISNFKIFHNNYNKNQDFGNHYEMISKIEDKEAIQCMKEIAKEENLIRIQNYDKEKKYEIIKKFIQIEGIKKIQIARILGMNRKLIEKIGKEMYQKGQMYQKETSPMEPKKYGKSKDSFCM